MLIIPTYQLYDTSVFAVVLPNTVRGRKCKHFSRLQMRKLRLKPKSPNSSFQCLKHCVHVVLISWWNKCFLYLKKKKTGISFGWASLLLNDEGLRRLGLNPGKMKQIFNSHINGGFSTSNSNRQGLLLQFPPQLLSLLSYDHALWFMVPFWSYRGTKVANNPTLHLHIFQALASNPGSNCGPLFILFWTVPYHRTRISLSPVNQ